MPITENRTPFWCKAKSSFPRGDYQIDRYLILRRPIRHGPEILPQFLQLTASIQFLAV